MKFEILIKHKDGTISRLSTGPNCAMSWCKKTAKKHAADCQALILNGLRPEWRYVVVLPV